MIEAHNIALTRGQNSILRGVDLKLNKGDCVGLIGPNGSGKTSLMRAIMHFDPSATGSCNLWPMSAKTRAETVAWLAQERQVAWGLTVEEVVALGRTAWRDWRHKAANDAEFVEAAITRLDLQSFRHRRFHELSGGERARVLIARVLAQDTPFILADEPIDALDPAQQIRVMTLFRALADQGKGVLISIHDLSLAARFCTRVILLDQGQIVAEGDQSSVLNDANLAQVFGIQIYRGEAQGPILQPIQIVENAHGKS